MWVFVGVTLLLGWLGSQPPEGGYVLASQVCTAYYFAHFLIVMPLCGLFETPKALPGSILESVTGRASRSVGRGCPSGRPPRRRSRAEEGQGIN